MTAPDGEQDPMQAIREAAYAWHVRLGDERVDQADRDAFERWCSLDPRHRQEYQRVDSLWRRLGDLYPTDRASELNQVPEHAPSKLNRRALWGSAAAAILALAIVVPGLLTPGSEPTESVDKRYSTARGDVRTVTLPDGSKATLGADSALHYADDALVRRVGLTRGVAFFDVVRSSGRPFRVSAGPLLLEVMGTAFDVRLGESETRVAVREGRVRVTYPATNESGTARPPARTQELAEGMAVTASPKSGLRQVHPVSSEDVGAWRDGWLIYVGMPLTEVLSDLNRYSSVPVELAHPALADVAVSGSFDARNPGQTLDVLGEILPLRIDRSAPERIILRRANR